MTLCSAFCRAFRVYRSPWHSPEQRQLFRPLLWGGANCRRASEWNGSSVNRQTSRNKGWFCSHFIPTITIAVDILLLVGSEIYPRLWVALKLGLAPLSEFSPPENFNSSPLVNFRVICTFIKYALCVFSMLVKRVRIVSGVRQYDSNAQKGIAIDLGHR